MFQKATGKYFLLLPVTFSTVWTLNRIRLFQFVNLRFKLSLDWNSYLRRRHVLVNNQVRDRSFLYSPLWKLRRKANKNFVLCKFHARNTTRFRRKFSLSGKWNFLKYKPTANFIFREQTRHGSDKSQWTLCNFRFVFLINEEIKMATCIRKRELGRRLYENMHQSNI